GIAVSRTQEELKKIQDLVAAAVGVDEKRGDLIVVQTIPFDQPTLEVHTGSWLERNAELVRSAIKYGALALVALLLFIFVIRPAKRALRQAANAPRLRPAPLALSSGYSETSSANGLGEARTVAEIEAEMEAQVAREMSSSAPEVLRATTLKKQLVERSRQQPESAAMTIRGWLQENQR
ncbi:MAG: flagellar M-ring protein FliF, partial [Blastocatellia bacterium]|nr:flagellar M-ring protein FliF [Blastocatellia bacterium]